MSNYGFEIDTWALGCTLAEMYTGKTIFSGRSEIEMLGMMANIVGNINVTINYLLQRVGSSLP